MKNKYRKKNVRGSYLLISEWLLFLMGFFGIILSLVDNPFMEFLWEVVNQNSEYFIQDTLSISQALLLSTTSAIVMFLAFERKTLIDILGNVSFLNFMLSLPDEVRMVLEDVGLLHKELLPLTKKSSAFLQLSQSVVDEQKRVLTGLAEGKISVQVELGIRFTSNLLNEFSDSFDGVSYKELDFWTHTTRRADGEAKGDFGRKYYDAILSFVKSGRTRTRVTRIFVLSRNSLIDDNKKKLLAEVLDKHLSDGIGVAVAFVENFGTTLEQACTRKNEYETNFGLLNGGEGILFFRYQVSDVFEAQFLELGNEAKEKINSHIALHKTLVVACTLGSKIFEDRMKLLYKNEDISQIFDEIKSLRKRKDQPQSEHMFAVTLPEFDDLSEENFQTESSIPSSNEEYRSSRRIQDVIDAIDESIEASKKFGNSIVRLMKF